MKSKERKTGRIEKLLIFSLFMLIFILGIILSIEPVTISLVRQTFINQAVVSRVNDVIFTEYPNMTVEDLITLNKGIEKNKNLDLITSKYLNSIVTYVSGGLAYEEPDIHKNFQELNKDILNSLEGKLSYEITETNKENLHIGLKQVEGQITNILNDLPNFINNFDSYLILLLKVYGLLISKLLLIGLLLLIITLIIGLYSIIDSKDKWLKNIAIISLINGIILGLIIPFFINIFSLVITNRIIGRSIYINNSAFFLLGGIYTLLGLIIFYRRKK